VCASVERGREPEHEGTGQEGTACMESGDCKYKELSGTLHACTDIGFDIL